MSSKVLWLATTNRDKVKEMAELLKSLEFEVHSPAELPAYTAPHENGSTFKENALIKARFLHSVKSDCWVLSDDSGLEADGLGGLPGVYSARYAGPRASAMENNSKLLKAFTTKPPGTTRAARFKCVMCLFPPGEASEPIYFEGVMEGQIAKQEKGRTGFGYDPVFIPQGHEQTVAELGMAVKNRLSHRAQALRQVVNFLKEKN